MRIYVFALCLAASLANAFDLDVFGLKWSRRFDFNIPAQPLESAAEAFAEVVKISHYIGHKAYFSCAKLTVQPIVGKMTSDEAWRRMTAHICAASGLVFESNKHKYPVYMVDHPWITGRPPANCTCPAIFIEPAIIHTGTFDEVVAMPKMAEVAYEEPRGHRELPRVMFIVPWKEIDLRDHPAFSIPPDKH